MGEKKKIIRCAECGNEIPEGEDYYVVEDNFLQAQYFDGQADNCFCSEECLCRSLLVESHRNDGHVEFGEDSEDDDEE